MSRFDYARLRATADRLIDRFGKPATLTRKVRAAPSEGGPRYEWDEPSEGEPDAVPIPITVVEDKATTRYSRDDAGALIPRSVRVLMITASGEAPRMGDTITLADGPHEIARLAPLEPGDTVLLYEVEIAA